MRFFERTVFLVVTGMQWCAATPSAPAADPPAVYPLADAQNHGAWIHNAQVSDEFEADQLDQSKWLIQGMNGNYRSNFIGRAPSQFSTENVRVEDGKLKLAAKWEPDFDFSDKIDRSDSKAKDGRAYENITTAAVISKRQLLYGYMEIKCKAADASVTSSFWMTGGGAELDVFEFLARPAQTHKTHLQSELWSSIHDWSSKGKGKSTWTDRLQLDWKVADGFHVYGIEWDPEYLKFHADGELVRTVTKQQVGEEGWVIDTPLWIWVDSETFPWHGVPSEADLPVDYEIEYIRVWQKETPDSQFLGFEVPLVLDGKAQDWWIDGDSSPHLSIAEDRAAAGAKALKFASDQPLRSKAVAFAPYGSLSLDAGEQTLSMKVWLEPDSSIKKLGVILEQPWLQLKPFDLTGVATGEWVTISQTFSRPQSSGEKDRVRIVLEPQDVPGSPSTLYIDELSFHKN